MSDDRTYQGITHKEIRKSGNTITKKVGGSLDDELDLSAYANKDPSASASNVIASPSRDIWSGMAPQSMYYVYKNKKGVYYVLDFGVTLSLSANGVLPKAIYEHKPPPARYTKDTNFNEYFLLSTGVTSREQVTGTLSLVMQLSGLFVAVYDQADGKQKLYSASTDVFSSPSVTSGTVQGGGATVGGATVGGATVGGATVGGATVGGATVGGAAGNGAAGNGAAGNGAAGNGAAGNGAAGNGAAGNGATGNGVPQTVSATTLATTPCAGPYSSAINKYNTDVLNAPITGKPIACSTAATEAKTKLTVTITPSVHIALGSVTFKDVPMEKKDDVWFGFMMIAPTTTSSSQWIQLEVKEQKLSYTACLGQCDAASPTYEQKKDLEVKHDKDKKYKFEGGTVEYTEIDPFSKGNLTLIILGLSIGFGVLLLIIGIFALAYAYSPKTKALVQNGLRSVRDSAPDRLPLLRSERYFTSSSTPPEL
jgi:hypothetical protein